MIWTHFSNLILLLKLSKDLILNINQTYLSFLEYKIYVLYNIDYSLDFIYSDFIFNLSEKFFLNNIFNIFYNKLILIQKSSNLINNNILFLDSEDFGYYIDIINIYSLFHIFENNG